MIFPATTQDSTNRFTSSQHGAFLGSGASEQSTIPEQKGKNAQRLWLGINALGGAIMGLLVYHSDALVRLAIRLLM